MKNKNLAVVVLSVFFLLCFIVPRFTSGSFNWPALGVGIIIVLIVVISSNRGVLKILGEYPNPKRNPNITSYIWFIATLFSIPIFFYLVYQMVNKETSYKNFAVFTFIPILLAIAFGVSRIPDITKKTKTGLIAIIKKLGFSLLLFGFFIPLYFLTNTLQIYTNITPDFLSLEAWGRGFIVYGMVFCFYAGLFLLSFSLVDLIIVLKDVSTRKPRNPKRKSKTSLI